MSITAVRRGLELPANLDTRPGKVDPEEVKREEIPIRLESEVEHHRMCEAFVWDLHGSYFALAFTLFES